MKGDSPKTSDGTVLIVAAPSDKCIMVKGSCETVEPSIEDECDLPDEESREPSLATNFMTEESLRNVIPPKDDTTKDPTTPSNIKNTAFSWLRNDEVAEVKSPPRNFWFRKKTQEGQDAVNIESLHDLDQRARSNEEIGTAGHGMGANQEQTVPCSSKTLRNFWSRQLSQSPVWRVATRTPVDTSSEQSVDTRVGVLTGFRKMMQRRTADMEPSTEMERKSTTGAENEAPTARQLWWRRFRRNRPDAARNQASSASEVSTEIIPYEAEPRPIVGLVKKAAAGITGACMVVVGIPLLLFPVPGPGVAMITSGVYVVSTEFEFVRSYVEKVKTRCAPVLDRLGIENSAVDALPAPAVESSPVPALQSSLSPAEVMESSDVKENDLSREEEMGDDDGDKEIIRRMEEKKLLERKDGNDAVDKSPDKVEEE